MDLNEFKNRIKTENLAGWYIFAGEEDYLKKYYLTTLRKSVVVDETFLPFNLTTFDGLDVDFDAMREAIEAPPMMSDYKLIEWKYANLDSLKEREKDALFSLMALKELYPSAIVAILATSDGFDMGTEKRPSKLKTKLSEGFDILTLDRSTDSQLLGWLKKHFDSEGISVDAPTLNALLFRAGRSMEILNNEVIKLSSYAKSHNKASVSIQDVEEISSSSTECDAFALSNAVTEKDLNKALAALTDLKMRRVDPSYVIAMLGRTYSELMSVSLMLDEGKSSKDIETLLRLHPFKAKLAIASAKRLGSKKIAHSLDTLRRLDGSSKSGGLSGYGVIEIFIMSEIPKSQI